MTSSAEPRDLEHLAAYDFVGRTEDDIRGDWIEPLLRLLGYGLGTSHRIARGVVLPFPDPTRMLGSKRIAIDFIPTVFNHRLWIIEAKRPQADLFDATHLGQAWSYATDPRVSVPLMMLCDGTRIGIFDVTTEDWPTPVVDILKADLPARFGELFDWIGAPRVAERVRRLQLRHLRTALETQLDLAALDTTLVEVQTIVDEVRPTVERRRREIRDGARAQALAKVQSLRDSAGMAAFAREVNEPWGPRRLDVEVARDIVLGKAEPERIDAFEQLELATTPAGQTDSRMWFSVRALRLALAVALSDTAGCSTHCESSARVAARQHSTGFAEEPLLRAVYRLQKALGRLGWRVAAGTRPRLEVDAARLFSMMDAEEWLRLDGEYGVTAEETYLRMARFGPVHIQDRISPWTERHINDVAAAAEDLLQRMDKPADMEQFQPAGDSWYDSWEHGDPLRTLSIALLEYVRDAATGGRVQSLAGEIVTTFGAQP